MKIAALVLLLSISFACSASPVEVGGVSIEIPTPTGFARVTPEMTALVELEKNFITSSNQELASFISENAVPTALEGKIPDLRRRFTVQIEKKSAYHLLTTEEFLQLEHVFKADWEQQIERLKSELPLLFSDASNRVSNQLDTNVVISASGVVPLPPHFESDRSFSASMLMKANVRSEFNKVSSGIIAATMTLVYVKNRLLFLYSYGDKQDLEWTRARSKEWADTIIAANQVPPPTLTASTPSAQSTDTNWTRIISMVIFGALLAVFGGWATGRRKKY